MAERNDFMTAGKPITAPEHIGRYRLTGELGRGGMGIVYRAEDRLIGREVAIKTLFEITPELRERFYLEARSGILSHPNIVTVYELGEHEGSPFIAMEFIAGESLEKVLRTRKRLPLVEALSIAEQLCAGIGHAHAHGVVHRDVKPANILVRPDGRISIVDFGIARLADQARQLTKTDALLGTFHYIAPERLKGEPSDGRADIWSIGVILYEMLTGELPFKGKDVSSLYRVIHEPYIMLTEYVQDLPEGVVPVLDRVLAKDVSARYATAEEVALDLQVLVQTLKQDHVQTLLQTARRLVEERQFASAGTVLLQAQRIDPGNTSARALMHEVQDRLSHLQRGEQLRQVVEQAQTAVQDRRWDEAIVFFQQAIQLDPEDALDLAERLEKVLEHKRKQQQVVLLCEKATEARSRHDLTSAQKFLQQALEIDDRNTDLRNAHTVLLREIERKQKGLQVDELLRIARENYGAAHYTEALARLREAADLDPARTDVQQQLLTVIARQKEARRQHLLEKIVAEIQESLQAEDFGLCEDRVARALVTLPGEPVLLALKAEIESSRRQCEHTRIVRQTMADVQELFEDHPQRALETLDSALQLAPESEVLKQSRAQVQEHLRNMAVDGAHAEALSAAHDSMAALRFTEACRRLEAFINTYGATENTSHLLQRARAEQARQQREEAESRHAEETRAAIATAVATFTKLLAAADLKRCLRPLEELAKQRGAEPQVAEALARCKQERTAVADGIVGAAIDEAQRMLTQRATKEACGVLRRADAAAPFTNAGLATEYSRQKRECESAARARRKPVSLSLVPDRRRVAALAAAALVAIVLIVALFRSHHHRADAAFVPQQQTVPSPQIATAQHTQVPSAPATIERTDMEINATPWAHVVQVEDAQGKAIPLPDGDQMTPLRLEDVAAGSYRITLSQAANRQQVVACDISPANHLCTAVLDQPDLLQAIEGTPR